MMGAAGAVSPAYIEDVFSTWLYRGSGGTQTITNGIDLSGKGGLVWIKASNAATGHRFTDTARGATKSLASDSTAAEATDSTGLTSFNSTGFVLGSNADYNLNTYASWTFRKAAKFFDVVTYTGNGSNRTIAHNLGSVPGTIIVKRRDTTGDWQVYHRSLANTEYMVLNSTAAKATDATRWNSTTPTSTEFSLGTDATVNANAGTYVAYLFAHDAGGFGNSGSDNVVSCGTFTGSGAGNTTTVTLGWEPQWILAKRTDGTQNWVMMDNMRGMPNDGDTALLYPNLSNAESTGIPSTGYLRPTATGFLYGPDNYMGDTAQVVYIAIRRGPMKTPTDATKVFNAATVTNDNTEATVGFPVDTCFNLARVTANKSVLTRLLGTNYLRTNSSGAALGGAAIWFTSNTDMGGPNITGTSAVYECFRRAPGFFDVVAYTGTGANRTVSHNLGVAPELMIVKARNSPGGFDYGWAVYSVPTGNNSRLVLNEDFASAVSTSSWNSTAPGSSSFTVGTNAATNDAAGTYIAYLFATAPGVSKVGSYTGTGTTLSVDCGFTAGSRLILIKRTDSTGSWYVWDTARGIVSADDPYLLLNSTAAEVTNTDYIDPLSSGFQISSTAPADINANGGSFIYLAVA
jgi:hypothetical protein